MKHSIGEYVRGKVHTNGIESFWALLKRGYYGVFHHFTWKHLQRYLDEFEVRWNMAGMAGQESVYERADCFENLQLSFFIGEVVAGTVKIDFDAREAKPGSKGLRNHGTKFRISPDDICRIYAKKERLC